jgi:hypothetical protein
MQVEAAASPPIPPTSATCGRTGPRHDAEEAELAWT